MNELHVLLASAVLLGMVHTAIGVDHSLPFVVLARTRGWTLKRTLFITSLCGVAHVMSSVLIASVGLGVGMAASRVAHIEETRGAWAAWLLIAFGSAYAVTALWKFKTRSLRDGAGAQGSKHRHRSADDPEVLALPTRQLMPTLFVIFALGPCEALLPLLTTSGVSLSTGGAALVALVFSAATIVTMLTLVAVGYGGAVALSARTSWLERLEPYTHVLAGALLALSGLTIQVLGI